MPLYLRRATGPIAALCLAEVAVVLLAASGVLDGRALSMAQVFQRLLLATEHTEFDTGAERWPWRWRSAARAPLAVVLPLVSNPEYEAVAPQLAAHGRSPTPPPGCSALREQARGGRRGDRAAACAAAPSPGARSSTRRASAPPT